ncbi:MAG TPA: DinB family protein [Bacillales bacterium]|nr:DinB family protein [Bacillales bacterium]
MEAVNTLRNVLLDEMAVGVRSTNHLIGKVNDNDWDYRPAINMRTLKELAEHLVAIPEVDLGIMQEKAQEEIQKLEAQYEAIKSQNELGEAMNKGYEALKTYMTSLSDEDFLTKETTAFYLEEGTTQARWLTETVTHIFHHRAQFFNYMKQLGYDINMFDLYL